MKTYQAYLSARTRSQITLSRGTRYEYCDGKVITLISQVYNSNACSSSRMRAHDAMCSVMNHYFKTMCSAPMICDVCRIESHKCWYFTGYPSKHICARCTTYLKACINNVSDRAITCYYINTPDDFYSPFIIILPRMIVATFIEENAIKWCDCVRSTRGDTASITEYRRALEYHSWLYNCAMTPLIENIRNIIINLALHDNDLGVDQTC